MINIRFNIMLENPEVGNKEEFVLIVQQKSCKYCGKMFTPNSPRPDLVQYCSQHCKYAADYSKKYRYTYTCTNCGAPIHRSRKLTGA